MSALTDPESFQLRDVEAQGDLRDNRAYRALLGLDEEPKEGDAGEA